MYFSGRLEDDSKMYGLGDELDCDTESNCLSDEKHEWDEKLADKSEFKSNSKKGEDKMTELIGLQNSNGIFEISSDNWVDSVFEFYSGMSYDECQSRCPSGVAFNLWITSLAIKIMEVKMASQKELWELIVQKGKKCLNIELNKDKEKFDILLTKAETIIST